MVKVAHRLGELLAQPVTGPKTSVGEDGTLRIGPFAFVIEWKGAGTSPAVAAAANQVLAGSDRWKGKAIPLVAVPFLGETGRRLCQREGVSWIDLSGNAHIVAPGLRILVLGQPNRFKHPGRPSSAFAPKSARVARWLLMHADEAMRQRDIAQATGLSEGFTSRIVSRLEKDGLVTRQPDGRIRVTDPNLLLDAWSESYDFTKHHIVRGHVPARSSEALLGQLTQSLGERGHRYAATGLGAAWLLTRFAGFRIVSVYLEEEPSSDLLEQISFRGDPRGANVWLVVPNDEGVFQGGAEHGGVPCVHPIQIYLDLKGHPERAAEAAERLRAEALRWNRHA